jgi:hypothetical protein
VWGVGSREIERREIERREKRDGEKRDGEKRDGQKRHALFCKRQFHFDQSSISTHVIR